MDSDDVTFVDTDSPESSSSGDKHAANTMTFGSFDGTSRPQRSTGTRHYGGARQPPPATTSVAPPPRAVRRQQTSVARRSNVPARVGAAPPHREPPPKDIERGYVAAAASSSPPPRVCQSPSGAESLFEYKIPSDASGMLAPSTPPKSHTAQKNMFKSRVVLLLLLQVAFFAGSWCFDLTWPVPETVLGTCAFVGVFFLGISVLSLHAFKRMHPFSYLCVVMYNFFSVPYFIIAARFFESAFIGQFLAYYSVALLVTLFTSTCATVASTFLRTLFLVVLASGSAVSIVYAHYIERWLGPDVPAAFHHSCFAAFYVALSAATYVLYCINFPVDKYNCYDYVVAFIDINLFGVFKLFRRVRFCLSVLFIGLFIAALIAEKTLEFRHLYGDIVAVAGGAGEPSAE